MSDPSVFTTTFEREHGPGRGSAVGRAAGARELGATVYELDPGGQAAPYHVHHAQEELLIVLSGTPELRTPAGRRTLEPGAVVAFPRGPEGAHRLRNRSDAPCRYVVVSTTATPEVVEYPDADAVAAMPGPGSRGWVFPESAQEEYMAVVARAIAAEPER
ncbi:cupin domain-containing protein [Patulibacter sp. S7RM1-6]